MTRRRPRHDLALCEANPEVHVLSGQEQRVTCDTRIEEVLLETA